MRTARSSIVPPRRLVRAIGILGAAWASLASVGGLWAIDPGPRVPLDPEFEDKAEQLPPAKPAPPPAAKPAAPPTKAAAPDAVTVSAPKFDAIDETFDDDAFLSPSAIHLFAEAGVYLLEPHLDHNTAFTTVPASGPGQVRHFHENFSVAPQIAIGGLCDAGWGLRARWWMFDHSTDTLRLDNIGTQPTSTLQTPPVIGVPGFTAPSAMGRLFDVPNDRMTFADHLRVDAWDLEVLNGREVFGWPIMLAGGVRYAYLSQNYKAVRFNQGTGVSGPNTVNLIEDSDVLRAGRNFAGVGPTLALEVARPFGDTGFALYAGGRTSVLFGRERQTGFQQTTETIQGEAQAAPSTMSDFHHGETGGDDVRPVVELELGVQWARCFGRYGLFARAGLSFQDWFDTGTATTSDGDLTFFGLSLTGGVNY